VRSRRCGGQWESSLDGDAFDPVILSVAAPVFPDFDVSSEEPNVGGVSRYVDGDGEHDAYSLSSSGLDSGIINP
jgi:hypothetical protein